MRFSNKAAWLVVLLIVVGLTSFSRLNLGALGAQGSVSSNESLRYLMSALSGQIPPRFDSLANNGFGDARFTFEYPLNIWLGIPVALLGFEGFEAPLITLVLMIALFIGGLRRIERANNTRLLNWLRIASIALLFMFLELLPSDLPITILTLPWLVWASTGFVNKRATQKNRRWIILSSRESLILVLVFSISLLATSAGLALCLGLVLGLALTRKKSTFKPMLACLLWALSCAAWFLLPHYAEQDSVINTSGSQAYLAHTFDQKKAMAIVDDYPNQEMFSPNAAVKIGKHSKLLNNTYTVFVPEKSMIIEKTMFFPGWRVTADGQSMAIENPADHAGLVAFTLEAGTHTVKSQMTQRTWPRMVGNSLSLVGIVAWVWFWWKQDDKKANRLTLFLNYFRTGRGGKARLLRFMKKFWPRRNQ
jgi:hypothetical protein